LSMINFKSPSVLTPNPFRSVGMPSSLLRVSISVANCMDFSAAEIETLSSELGIPTDLKGFGVKTDGDLKLIIDNSMQLEAAFQQNPVKFGKDEIEKIVYSLR